MARMPAAFVAPNRSSFFTIMNAEPCAIPTLNSGSGWESFHNLVRIGNETKTKLNVPNRRLAAKVGRGRSTAIFHEHAIVAEEMRVGQRVQHALIGVDAAEEQRLDVESLDRAALVWHLFIMAVAVSLGAILLGVAADRLGRRGVGPQALLGFVAIVFIAAQLGLILRWPLPSYLLWAVVAAVGAATVLSYATLAEHFPKELAGRANGLLNFFHVGGAFILQYATGVVLQQWTPEAGHYPEIAFQTAFALNLAPQIVAGAWFGLSWVFLRSSKKRGAHPSESADGAVRTRIAARRRDRRDGIIPRKPLKLRRR